MIKVDNAYIITPVHKIVEGIGNHFGVFNDIHIGYEDIMVTCPFHSGGNESNPSMGIVTEDKVGVETGLVHCFACGWTGDLGKLVGELLKDPEMTGDQWLTQTFGMEFISQRSLVIDKRELVPEKTFVSPHFLEEFDKYHPYLEDRGITEETANRFMVRVDTDRGNILFPVRDQNGNIEYVAHRSLTHKRFHIPEGVDKKIYGLYEAMYQRTSSNELILCEGVFDAMSATQFGHSAVALLGTGSKKQLEIIKYLSPRVIWMAFDGDEAGHKGALRAMQYLTGYKMVGKIFIPEGRDVNDLTESEFNALDRRML
jgi:DNA primase